MKKLLPFVMLLIAGTCWAQGSRTDGIALGVRGPVPNAMVAVCSQPAVTTTQPCSPLATLYTDLTLGTASANPVTADSLGNYHFYAPVGVYTVQIYSPQISPPFVSVDQILNCDPLQCVLADLTVSGLTPNRCLQSGTNGHIVVASASCTTGPGTINGTAVSQQVAVGTSTNTIGSFSNFTYDGTILRFPEFVVNGGQTIVGIQGLGAELQAAGANDGVPGAALCNDANSNVTTNGCQTLGATILTFNQTFLLSPVTLSLGVNTTVITSSTLTMPATGCPCRIGAAYTANWHSTGVSLVSSFLESTDGTNVYDFAGLQRQEANSAQDESNGMSAQSGGTYANGATVTVVLHMQANQTAATVNVAAKFIGPNSNLEVWAITSN